MKERNEKNTECVKVVIRCRPLSEKEMASGYEVVVKINENSGEIWVNKPTNDEPPK
jgi:kinesin family protein 3/17